MAFSSDELEALQSIYCAQDELEVLSQSPTCILQFNLKASTSTADFPFSLTLEMDDKYPDGQDSCQMSLQCTALNRGQRDILMEKTKEFAASELLGE